MADDKPFAFRMQQPDPTRRYQIFPKETHLPTLSSGKALDPESAFAVAMNQAGESASAGLKVRMNQQTLVRRRKISVPELGPMTTVQEACMDSRKLRSVSCRPRQHRC